ncbi:MAG: hypothetical protein C5B59_00465 [Bacteroidetes bacterium]|nr:MAG: hypothetical protein C5B59_00465 [Bacteroidota bacterium]
MTVEEVAAFLKVTPRAVYEMSRNRSQVRSRHKLPAIRLHSKCLRFERAAVEAWVRGIADANKADQQKSRRYEN